MKHQLLIFTLYFSLLCGGIKLYAPQLTQNLSTKKSLVTGHKTKRLTGRQNLGRWLKIKHKKFVSTKFGKWCHKHKKGLIAAGITIPSVLLGSYAVLKAVIGLAMVPAMIFHIYKPEKSQIKMLQGISIKNSKVENSIIPGQLTHKIVIPAQKQSSLPASAQKTQKQPADKAPEVPIILYLVGNGMSAQFEDGLPRLTLTNLSYKAGCPVIGINYPGVAGSSGYPISFDWCVKQIVNQLTKIKIAQGWQDRQVIVMGHSLGGYIGAGVATKLGGCPLFIHRSLSSASKAAARIGPFALWITRPIITFCGWERDAEGLVLQNAQKGYLTAVANADKDYMMAPGNRRSVDARILPNYTDPKSPLAKATANLIVMNLKTTSSCSYSPHMAPNDEILVDAIQPPEALGAIKNEVEADNKSLGVAMVKFVEQVKKGASGGKPEG